MTPKRLVGVILAFGAISIFAHFHFHYSRSRNFRHVLHGFEANQGQFDSRTLFVMRTPSGAIGLTGDGPKLMAGDKPRRMLTWIRDRNHALAVEGLDQLRARANYFVGQDRRHWRSGVPIFGRVRYHEVAPGIDIDYYEQGGSLEFDVVIAPGAEPSRARFTIDPPFRLDSSGDLRLGPDDSAMTLRAPAVYQEIEGVRHRVDGRFAISADRDVGFDIPRYDKSRPLVIDPVLVASTFVGVAEDSPHAVASDSQGSIYVAGSSGALGIPDQQGFVAKFSSDTSELLYWTYFGGSGRERVNAIAVDAMGAAYIAGNTDSKDLPVVNALQPFISSAGCISVSLGGVGFQSCPRNGFVAKIAPDGRSLIYSTYLGGNTDVDGIGVDTAQSAYVAGTSLDPNFPLVHPANSIGCTDNHVELTPVPHEIRCPNGFIAKLAPTGSSLVYSTFIGGTEGETIHSSAVDAAGRVYIAGSTQSTDLPVVNAFQPSNGSGMCCDAFVGRLNAAGSAFEFLTYLGGEGSDDARGIAVFEGSAYVTGTTNSNSFPLRNPLHSRHFDSTQAPGESFATRFTPDGRDLVFSTFLGGSAGNFASSIAVDAAGNPSVAGSTDSRDFPIIHAYQRGYGRGFVTMLSANGTETRASTYLGTEVGIEAATIDRNGNTLVAGSFRSIYDTTFGGSPVPGNFPTLTNAFQPQPENQTEGFVGKLLPANATGILTWDAGTGAPGNGGSGLFGPQIPFGAPFHVATDASGNRYFADTFNNRVVRVGTDNQVQIVAGNGTQGFSGDGGSASDASLNSPYGIAVDTAGNLYIADTLNNRIRKVDAAGGLISTIAGNGALGFSGDGGPATQASLAAPVGLAVDNGRLIIADTYNHRIRAIDVNGVITTVAGNGVAGNTGDGGPATLAQLHTPTAVAVDTSARLLIANFGANTVRRVLAGTIETIAGTGQPGYSGDGGPAPRARLSGPTGVAVDSAGRIFVADEMNHRVRVITQDARISTLAGTGVGGSSGTGGTAVAAQLAYPVSVAADRFDNLYISDLGNHRTVRVFRYGAALQPPQ